MDKKNQEILKNFKPSQKAGDSMSQETINPEVLEKKDQPKTEGSQSTKQKKEGDKPGFFSVAVTKVKSTIIGGYTYAKESIATAWNAVVEYYKDVKKNIEEKGAMRWFIDGFRKNAFGFLKLSLKVTAFVLIHNVIVNATGFSILNPIFLLVILCVALGASAYNSYKAQKDLVGSADAKTTAKHVMSEMIAA